MQIFREINSRNGEKYKLETNPIKMGEKSKMQLRHTLYVIFNVSHFNFTTTFTNNFNFRLYKALLEVSTRFYFLFVMH